MLADEKEGKRGGRSGNDLLWNAAATKGEEEGEEEPRPPFPPFSGYGGSKRFENRRSVLLSSCDRRRRGTKDISREGGKRYLGGFICGSLVGACPKTHETRGDTASQGFKKGAGRGGGQRWKGTRSHGGENQTQTQTHLISQLYFNSCSYRSVVVQRGREEGVDEGEDGVADRVEGGHGEVVAVVHVVAGALLLGLQLEGLHEDLAQDGREELGVGDVLHLRADDASSLLIEGLLVPVRVHLRRNGIVRRGYLARHCPNMTSKIGKGGKLFFAALSSNEPFRLQLDG